MLFLFPQIGWFLLIAAAFGSVAGWWLHLRLSAPRLRDLERERDRLRTEFEASVTGLRQVGEEREQAFFRTRESIAAAKLAELDRALAEVREQRDAHAGRTAELERALERLSSEAAAAQRRADAAEAGLAQAHGESNTDEMNALRWRLRYFEARTRYLEGMSRTQPRDDPATIANLTAERDAARSEAEELREGQLAQPQTRGEEDEALKWRARYLESRVRRLESEAAAAIDEESANRQAWRMRYLEARLKHLAAAPAAQKVGDKETRRLEWRSRYLDARVQHLEQRLAGSLPSEPAPAPTQEPTETPDGAEVRPQAIAAPRDGAADDLMLIDGMSPKTASALNALGVYHFDQIAEWSAANIAWVDQYLRLRDRISREQWVEQARALARGAPTGRKLYAEIETA